MKKPTRKPGKNPHFCLLVNRQATRYDQKLIARYVSRLRSKGHYYTIVEPDSALDLARAAEVAAGLRKSHRFYTPAVSRRGKVSGLIACGGDGTVNLVARAATRANLPMGILPMGNLNNIARSLFGESYREQAINRVTSGKTRQIDTGEVGNQMFLGSVAFGLPTCLHSLLSETKRPRFGIGWSRLASTALEECPAHDLVIKVDSFRFEIAPAMVIISSLSHILGLPIDNVADAADGRAEVILDFNSSGADLGNYFKDISRGKYVYGADVRLFRGQTITVRPVQGSTMYLDGELIELPVNVVEITIGQKKVALFG